MLKNGFLKIFILIFSVTLFSCVEQGTSTKRRSSNSASASSGAETSAPTDTTELYWYFNGQKIEGIVTINQDIQTVAYVRGSSIHDYLDQNSNYNNQYCMAFSYNVGTTKNMLKVRAVPISITNFSTNTKERLLRVDFIENSINSSQCSGSVKLYTSAGNEDPTVVNPAYSPSDLCTNCYNTFTSTNIALYKLELGSISDSTIVDSTTSLTKGLNLAINPANLATDPVGTCSNTECNAKGFDCCLNGQCVKDAATKPNVNQSSAEYIQSQAEIANDPLNFLKWPDLYFVCPNIVRPTPPITTPDDPAVGADERFQALLKQYNCLEGVKLETPDYSACEATFDTAAYEIIRDDVWDKCGCDAVGDDRLIKCPDYGLKPILDEFDNIKEIVCDIPQPPSSPAPTQYLNTPVSVRSIPHRFYDTNGVLWDDVADIKDKSTLQEGQVFSYTDVVSKADPAKTQFSMNAVLGSVNLNLSTAAPAKMLKVDFDQTYVITVNTGYYTPCPQCADDAWFTTFKSRPSSYNGTGLQSSGYTTSRDTYGNNLTNGNYEDTIFGRACWLPPTMIPLTHMKGANLQAQRQNRLQTQAALYINGYQRDWFGFNQGALIGSFNGVNWFAIGKGRRITSTSEKLYLAINAPFADLADKTDLLVNVVTDQGGGTAADYDYDPSLAITDSRQNQGGSCQENHLCSVDSDCIQKLGWEYRCADISQHKSKWPVHDINANEKVNEEKESLNFSEIITGARASTTKNRCVYRGIGSLCSTNPSSITSTQQQKLFQCAPNFYCAQLQEDEFNSEIVRTPSQISNILYGQEADVLGRPKDYLAGSEARSLESTLKVNTDGTTSVDDSQAPQSTIIDQIKNNAALYAGLDVNSLGLCKPGKDISQVLQTDMQTAKDTNGRADYINQISSCDSSDTDYGSRTRACPVFDTYGNIVENPSTQQTRIQNMCGGAAISDIGGTEKSVFFEIESDPVAVLADLLQPKIAKDACLRKAGSYCQTDLDCGPNKLHAQMALFYDQSYFGGTEAEHKYWQEYLVCGQGQPKPSFTSDSFDSYDMSQNRCCRETGKTLTMFTQTTSTIVSPSISGSPNLNANPFDTGITPSTDGRYSRYSVVNHENFGSSFIPVSTLSQSYNTPKVLERQVGYNATTPNSRFQWTTMNETAQRTCCGRGWVRKFADGTNDWTQKNRLSLNPTDFACLNTKSKLPFITDPEAELNLESGTYYSEYSRLCAAPADNNGCIQNAIIKSTGFEIEAPTNEATGLLTLSTLPDEDPTSGTLLQVNTLSVNKPFVPTPFQKASSFASTGPFNYMASPNFDQEFISMILPSYISAQDTAGVITSVGLKAIRVIKITDGGETYRGAVPHETAGFGITAATNLACSAGASFPNWPVEDTWCLELRDGKIILKVSSTEEAATNDPGLATPLDKTDDFTYGGIEIDFQRQSQGLATEPGNDLFYLKKLAKLELLGIPQIYFEPIYCNNDRNETIPGVYEGVTTAAQVASDAKWFDYPTNSGKGYDNIYENGPTAALDGGEYTGTQNTRVTHADGIARSRIWSDSEFMCCLNLGQETEDAGLCCSGYAPDPDSSNGNPDAKRTCKLPRGTDLHVYFNKYVSGDGMGDDQPGGGLLETDFVPETGEIKMNNSAVGKVKALGAAYCESGAVRGGAAFGYFYAEPNTGNYFQNGDLEDSKMWSIVDSNQDYDDANDTGFVRFLDGYRWNNHVYCD
ncbi:hypothetical protein [Halobacteriovorax sp. HLS]|uniref:hypothetical protein n=1 Tax=Halobacteriovorax sp. HLS TaxID=2234000 RepID=UPI000FD80DDE|nr:hypothetical protein [Halobacteriovorax sp. HLS]